MDESRDGVSTDTLFAVISTLLAAIAGFATLILQHNYEREKRTKKLRLELVNRQLRELYGPLYGLSKVSSNAWDVFCDENVTEGPIFPTTDTHRVLEFRRWHRTTLHPLKMKMENIIMANVDLIAEDPEEPGSQDVEASVFPTCFVKFVTHTNSMKPLLDKWASSGGVDVDCSSKANCAIINFPRDFHPYIERVFRSLRAEQQRLISTLKPHIPAARSFGEHGTIAPTKGR